MSDRERERFDVQLRTVWFLYLYLAGNISEREADIIRPRDREVNRIRCVVNPLMFTSDDVSENQGGFPCHTTPAGSSVALVGPDSSDGTEEGLSDNLANHWMLL